MSAPLRLRLGTPSHGWLPVDVVLFGEECRFFASNIPADPLESLADAVELFVAGRPAHVEWYCEPEIVEFRFMTTPAGGTFCVSRRSSEGDPVDVFRLHDTVRRIALPHWRALREFQSHPIELEHWQPRDLQLARLKSAIDSLPA